MKCLKIKLKKFQREDKKHLFLYGRFSDYGNEISYKGKDFYKQTSQNTWIISYKIDIKIAEEKLVRQLTDDKLIF